MKIIALIFFTILTIQSFAQDWPHRQIHTDTVITKNWADGKSVEYSIGNGFNQLFDSTGLIEEGMATIIKSRKQYEGKTSIFAKLSYLFHEGNRKSMVKVGLWTYYKNNKIIGYETFSAKGFSISKIEFYNDGKLKTKSYKWGNEGYTIDYFPNGDEVNSWDEFSKWIELQNKSQK